MGGSKHLKDRGTEALPVRQIANLFMLCCEARLNADRGKRYRKIAVLDDITLVVEAGSGRGVIVRPLKEKEHGNDSEKILSQRNVKV
jgi:hypothetical protein